MSLDTSTLYFIATMIAAMLGVMLLVFGKNENIPALKWWGTAYLLGAASVALWSLASNMLGEVVSLALNAVGFVACGMVWNASRVFHGRKPNLPGLVLGALAWIAVAVRRMNYALFAALVTPVFVLLAETNAGAGHLTRVRILDTLLGGTLALAGAIALWPTRDLDRMPALIAAILRADRVYLDAVLHGQGPAGTVAARRRVGLATANAEAALQRLIAEALPPARVETLMALVAYGRRLSASITAVGAAPPSPQYAAQLEGILDALADAAQSGAPPPPVPPLDNPAEPEPAQRLARQLRVVQSALARLG